MKRKYWGYYFLKEKKNIRKEKGFFSFLPKKKMLHVSSTKICLKYSIVCQLLINNCQAINFCPFLMLFYMVVSISILILKRRWLRWGRFSNITLPVNGIPRIPTTYQPKLRCWTPFLVPEQWVEGYTDLDKSWNSLFLSLNLFLSSFL